MVGLHSKDLGSIAEHSGVSDKGSSTLVCGHTCAQQHAPVQPRSWPHSPRHRKDKLHTKDRPCQPCFGLPFMQGFYKMTVLSTWHKGCI